jgi:hypothetical protein
VTTCVECGNDRAVTRASTGMICLGCQQRLNEQISAQLHARGPLTQTVDPDIPPMHCCVDECDKDAVVVTRMPISGREMLLLACTDHTDLMTELIAELRSGYSIIEGLD